MQQLRPPPAAGAAPSRQVDLVRAHARATAAVATSCLAMQAPPLSLYVHIPWCVKKCPYCDFNSHAKPGALPVDEYVAALLADLERDLRVHGVAIGTRKIHSVFFGGGTPSLFPADAIARVIDGAHARIGIDASAEITLETNPGTLEYGRLDGYRDAGVNRLSFGVQSFDDDKLARLGRIHLAADAERAIVAAHAAGLDNFNIDLMYALPEQTQQGALADLERAIALRPAHISHYQLTIEPNTLFAAQPPGLPDDDTAADMQDACQARLAEAGFAQYEVSAYAQAGRCSAHNLNYWRFGDYLGIGAGAHGKLSNAVDGNIVRTTKLKTPSGYLARAANATAFGDIATVKASQHPFEFMLNALRLVDGVPIDLFEARCGLPRAAIATALAKARAKGLLDADATRIRATERGRRFLNDVIELFMAA